MVIENEELKMLSPAEILGLTIIGEGRGEPIEGQVAIGCVCRNRISHNPGKYHSYFDVVLEPLQFSCWNNNDTNKSYLLDLATILINGQYLTDPYLKQCMLVARGIVDWEIVDNTNGAVNYMTNNLYHSISRPSWAHNAKNEKIIGRQTFFTV